MQIKLFLRVNLRLERFIAKIVGWDAKFWPTIMWYNFNLAPSKQARHVLFLLNIFVDTYNTIVILKRLFAPRFKKCHVTDENFYANVLN